MPTRTGAPLPPLMPRNAEIGQEAGAAEATKVSDMSQTLPSGAASQRSEQSIAASEPMDLSAKESTATGANASEIVVIVNGQAKVLKGKSSYLLVDVLDVVAFSLADARGRQPIVKVNGTSTTFMQAIKDSDVIELGWKS